MAISSVTFGSKWTANLIEFTCGDWPHVDPRAGLFGRWLGPDPVGRAPARRLTLVSPVARSPAKQLLRDAERSDRAAWSVTNRAGTNLPARVRNLAMLRRH